MTFFCYIFRQDYLLLVNILEHPHGRENPLPSGYGTCELIYIHAVFFFCIFSACIHFGLNYCTHSISRLKFTKWEKPHELKAVD